MLDTSPSTSLIKLSTSGAVFPSQHFRVCAYYTTPLVILPIDFLPLISGIFPLFTNIMYKNLGYPQASSLLGGLAFAFSILPFFLMAYGPRIRQKSRVAKQIAWQQEGRAAQAVMNMHERAGWEGSHEGRTHRTCPPLSVFRSIYDLDHAIE